MGNCLFGGFGDHAQDVIKVIKSDGGILEFYAPITVGHITKEFPGHSIFKTHDLFWKPLALTDDLLPGQSYYLLPISDGKDQIVREGHVRSRSESLVVAPYRMSLDYQGMLKRSHTDAFSRSTTCDGVWKVKLAISQEMLVEILSQETRTQELIENVRAVAKCGNNGALTSSLSSSTPFSDQWSLSSSSRNATSSVKDGVC